MPGGSLIGRLARRLPVLRLPFDQRDAALRERDALAREMAALRAAAGFSRPASPAPPDLRATLRSLDEWRRFTAKHPRALDPGEASRIVAFGAANGVEAAFLGPILPNEITVSGENYREQYIARGFSARQRALLDLLEETVGDRPISDPRIYAHEAMSNFALVLRGRFPRFLGSEYIADEADYGRIYPIPAIDVTKSGLPASSFDVVLSGDVLEHVSDLDAALRDTRRILVPGGRLIATVPFACDSADTIVKARLIGRRIEYLAPAEYHGNLMDPAGGALVFQIPGWSVIAAARDAGFSDACMVFWSSHARGFVGSPNLAGLFLLVAIR